MWKSKKLSPKVFQIDQFNLILYHGCRHIDHYPCYWKIPQHVAQGGAMWWKFPKMKKDKKIIKLPDSFKRYNYFRSFDVRNIPGEKSFQAFQDWHTNDCFNAEVRIERFGNHHHLKVFWVYWQWQFNRLSWKHTNGTEDASSCYSILRLCLTDIFVLSDMSLFWS